MKNLLKTSRGMSLIEVLIAMTLLAIFIAAIISSVVYIRGSSDHVDRSHTLSNLAMSRIEYLQEVDFDRLPVEGPEIEVRINLNGEKSSTGSYIRTTEVEEDYEGSSYLVRIKVSVDKLDGDLPIGLPSVAETLFVEQE